MRKGWQGLVLIAATGLSVAVLAQEKQPLTLRERTPLTGPEFSQKPTPPPQEMKDLMRKNQSILAVDNISENVGAAGGGAGVTTFNGSLGRALTPGKEDYDAVLKDTPALKETFAKIETFFAERSSKEGVQLAKDGQQAIADLEAAAMAKDRVAASKAEIALSVTCRNCHIGHRVLLITMPISFGVIG